MKASSNLFQREPSWGGAGEATVIVSTDIRNVTTRASLGVNTDSALDKPTVGLGWLPGQICCIGMIDQADKDPLSLSIREWCPNVLAHVLFRFLLEPPDKLFHLLLGVDAGHLAVTKLLTSLQSCKLSRTQWNCKMVNFPLVANRL